MSASTAAKEAAVVSKEVLERIPYQVVRRQFRRYYGSKYSPATVVFSDKAIDHWMSWPYDNVPHPEDTIDEAYVVKKHPSIDLPQEIYDKRPFYAKLYVPNQRKHVIDTMIRCERSLQRFYKTAHERNNITEAFDQGMAFNISFWARVLVVLLLIWAPFGFLQFTGEDTEIYKSFFGDTWVDKKKPPVGVRPWDKMVKDPVTGEWTLKQ